MKRARNVTTGEEEQDKLERQTITKLNRFNGFLLVLCVIFHSLHFCAISIPKY